MKDSRPKNIIQVCQEAMSKFRYQPKPDYIANLAIALEEEKYTAPMVEYLFQMSFRIHDQYPSLAQLLELGRTFEVKKRFGPPEPLPLPPPPKGECPWPKTLELFLKNRADASSNSSNVFLKKFIKLEEEEILEMEKFYGTRDFLNPRAVELVLKAWPKGEFYELAGGLVKKI